MEFHQIPTIKTVKHKMSQIQSNSNTVFIRYTTTTSVLVKRHENLCNSWRKDVHSFLFVTKWFTIKKTLNENKSSCKWRNICEMVYTLIILIIGLARYINLFIHKILSVIKYFQEINTYMSTPHNSMKHIQVKQLLQQSNRFLTIYLSISIS